MVGVHFKTVVVTASTLLSFCAAQAVGSYPGMYRHIEIAPILGSSQEPVAGAPALHSLMSTQRLLRQVSLERGVFLVAKRHIRDPRFKQTVILITGYDSWGSVGLVVNRPSEIPVVKLLPEWSGLVDAGSPVYYGGPVELGLVRFLIRSSRPLDIGNRVFEDVYMVASKPTFDTFLRDQNANDVIHAYIGYAGWAKGQLEHEVDRGDWYVIKGDANSLFDRDPEVLWKQFIRALSGNWVYQQPGSTGIAPGSFAGRRMPVRRTVQSGAAVTFNIMTVNPLANAHPPVSVMPRLKAGWPGDEWSRAVEAH